MRLTSTAEFRGALLYAKLIHRLITQGDAYRELSEYTGLSYHTVIRYIKSLREFKDDNGYPLVRIIGWEECERGQLSRPVFKLEPGPDVRRPKMSRAQRLERQRVAAKNKRLHLKMNRMVSSGLQQQAQ